MEKARRSLLVGLLALGIASVACSDSDAVPGRITIKNDIQDRDYNRIVVDGVTRNGGSTGFRATLGPGEKATIPFPGVTSIRLSRRYKDFTRYYVVHCPPKQPSGLVLKMIAAHVNRIGGGCETVEAYER